MSKNNMERSIGRLEGKVDSLIVDVKRLGEVSEGKIDKLEGRVVKLEKRQYTIVIIASIAWTGLLTLFRKYNLFG